jgi:hypothetical protein
MVLILMMHMRNILVFGEVIRKGEISGKYWKRAIYCELNKVDRLEFLNLFILQNDR